MIHHHYIIHKPYGYLSQFVNNHRRKKRLLSDLHPFPPGVMAIGRLDVKSEGLLLLTTDGKMSQLIREKAVEKEYYVQVDGLINEQAIEQLKSGVMINVEGQDYLTRPCKSHILPTPPDFPARAVPVRNDRHGPTRWISVTLTEGKFKQVRKMTAAVRFPTLRLVRVRIGNINLGDLTPGTVVAVNDFEY